MAAFGDDGATALAMLQDKRSNPGNRGKLLMGMAWIFMSMQNLFDTNLARVTNSVLVPYDAGTVDDFS